MRARARTKNMHNEYANIGVQTSITEASPHRLVQILFESALAEMLKAKGAMAKEDVKIKGIAISQAIAIIGTLRSSLNMELGGELSMNLSLLYEYIMRRLLVSNQKNDIHILEECLSLLRPVKESWDQIAPVV